MSFHTRLAEAARRDGNTPAQFRAGAQAHANAFWRYPLIAAVVWYFADWRWALLPGAFAALAVLRSVSSTMTAVRLEKPRGQQVHIATNSPLPLPDKIDLNEPSHLVAIDYIRDKYSTLLADDSSAYAQCMYRPAAELPFPKETIRRALSALLAFVEGRQESRLVPHSLRSPEVADSLRIALTSLEGFLDVSPNQLPTEPSANLRAGAGLLST